MVYQSIHNSTFREHKLHLRTLLRGAGAQLTAQLVVGRGNGATQARVLALVDSAVDLEFYMPVKEHLARWTPDGPLLVATALHDHEIPIANDLNGTAVRLSSAEIAPTIPTLALVPVEQDFPAIATPPPPQFKMCMPESCGGTGGGGPASG